MRVTVAALALAVTLTCGMPAPAQVAPASPTGSNPIAQSVAEDQVLKAEGRAKGTVRIPDQKEAILEQPQGRRYQTYHEHVLPWLGGVVIVGVLLALGLFYWRRGAVELEFPPTGIKIERFGAGERLMHWMTATSFIVLAITGLNYVFGKRLLMPLIGPEAFAIWSQWAKFLHNAFAWPFMLGLITMFIVWVKGNLPDRYDREWLRRMGGLLSHHDHPPALRFNAGQKLMFWVVVLAGGVLIASGLALLFPFTVFDINGMQLLQYVHGIVATLLVGLILGHIYIGTIGIQGAFDAMKYGYVDLAWAKEHHSAWVQQLQSKRERRPGLRGLPPE